jgi:hypothetical protein
MSDLIICVDFDGTLCDHRFPDIGGEVPGAFHWLKQFQAAGAKLILWTMRSDLRNPADDGKGPTPGAKADRDYLTAAVEWCRERGVEFWGVNQNPPAATLSDSRALWLTGGLSLTGGLLSGALGDSVSGILNLCGSPLHRLTGPFRSEPEGDAKWMPRSVLCA